MELSTLQMKTRIGFIQRMRGCVSNAISNLEHTQETVNRFYEVEDLEEVVVDLTGQSLDYLRKAEGLLIESLIATYDKTLKDQEDKIKELSGNDEKEE